MQNLAFWAGFSIIVFYLLSSVWISYHRLVWYDEALTILIARLPARSTFFAALAGAASALPPGHFIAARLFDSVLGTSDGALRIPYAFALAAGLFIVFDCARRASDNLHGLAAIALLTSSLLPYYGYEARPYATYFLLVAVGMWLWIHPASGEKWMAALFGATFLLAFSLHYYSALCLIPYFLFEASQWKRWQLPSAKLVAGGLGVLGGAALCWPHILQARKFSPGFWAPPSVFALRQLFAEFFPHALLIAAAALIWVAWMVRAEKTLVGPMLPLERLGWFSLAIPMAGYVVAKLATNAFYNRYFIGMLPGLAVAVACALWRHFGRTPRVSLGIIAMLLLPGIGKQLEVTARPWKIEPPSAPGSPAQLRAMIALEPVLLKAGKKAVVISADRGLGLEILHYSRHPEAYSLLVHPGMEPTGRAHLNIARFYPLRFWNMDELRAHAAEVALISPSEDLQQSLRAAGFQVLPLDSKELGVVYLVPSR